MTDERVHSPAPQLPSSHARSVRAGASCPRALGQRETGVTFLWVAVALFVLAVLLLFAVQPASIIAQRMKEQELLFRGREYTEAIRNYQYEHGGGFPTHLEDLLKVGPKNHRYIRKVWSNPFDPDGLWGILAPGSTVVTVAEDGKITYNFQAQPSPGQSPMGQPQQPPGQPPQVPGGTGGGETEGTEGEGGQQSGSKSHSYVLPFRLDGEDGQPIVGVYCKLHKKSFSEFFGKNYYDEWFFSPLVVPPPPPVQGGSAPGPAQRPPPVSPPGK
jgi:type II secretory pathway pseudopilin PulG